MLVLKALLVPAFILGISLAAIRRGPRVGGLLAGLPVVAGPILFLLYVEHGGVFAGAVAIGALGAVCSTIAFCASYAHASRRWNCLAALGTALFFWGVAACLLALLPLDLGTHAEFALAALVLAPRLFPHEARVGAPGPVSSGELGMRMLAGAALTLLVSGVSNHVGPRGAGLLAAFPVIGAILATFSHRRHGSAYAIITLQAMARGLYSFAAFMCCLGLSLPMMPGAYAFVVATAASVLVQYMVLLRRA